MAINVNYITFIMKYSFISFIVILVKINECSVALAPLKLAIPCLLCTYIYMTITAAAIPSLCQPFKLTKPSSSTSQQYNLIKCNKSGFNPIFLYIYITIPLLLARNKKKKGRRKKTGRERNAGILLSPL